MNAHSIASIENNNKARQRDSYPRICGEIRDQLKSALEAEHALEAELPTYQKFPVLSTKGFFTNAHIDLSATATFFHVKIDRKVFNIAPPTSEKLEIYERVENEEKSEWIEDPMGSIDPGTSVIEFNMLGTDAMWERIDHISDLAWKQRDCVLAQGKKKVHTRFQSSFLKAHSMKLHVSDFSKPARRENSMKENRVAMINAMDLFLKSKTGSKTCDRLHALRESQSLLTEFLLTNF
ncbi:hypothetical protein B9Z55_027591 [Caenorhabditis nigoni]|uniref:Uncharacterized protein n=1 Tax=Caenorhabditis nigoni TaxID=1611254 RepID=A0A2G5SFB4_9PELO|nr:hypothetical protein B9Z55_027591 [Caenorhabditis nigoni]